MRLLHNKERRGLLTVIAPHWLVKSDSKILSGSLVVLIEDFIKCRRLYDTFEILFGLTAFARTKVISIRSETCTLQEHDRSCYLYFVHVHVYVFMHVTTYRFCPD